MKKEFLFKFFLNTNNQNSLFYKSTHMLIQNVILNSMIMDIKLFYLKMSKEKRQKPIFVCYFNQPKNKDLLLLNKKKIIELIIFQCLDIQCLITISYAFYYHVGCSFNVVKNRNPFLFNEKYLFFMSLKNPIIYSLFLPELNIFNKDIISNFFMVEKLILRVNFIQLFTDLFLTLRQDYIIKKIKQRKTVYKIPVFVDSSIKKIDLPIR
jgi:hypothetical protein